MSYLLDSHCWYLYYSNTSTIQPLHVRACVIIKVSCRGPTSIQSIARIAEGNPSAMIQNKTSHKCEIKIGFSSSSISWHGQGLFYLLLNRIWFWTHKIPKNCTYVPPTLCSIKRDGLLVLVLRSTAWLLDCYSTCWDGVWWTTSKLGIKSQQQQVSCFLPLLGGSIDGWANRTSTHHFSLPMCDTYLRTYSYIQDYTVCIRAGTSTTITNS